MTNPPGGDGGEYSHAPFPAISTTPMAPPIYPAAVYACENPSQAASLLNRETPGYVYSRDGHPNADHLAEMCRAAHNAEDGIICGSGMAAESTLLLGMLESGDHLVASGMLYGQTTNLIRNELARLKIGYTEVDPCNLHDVRQAMQANTKGIFVETISNPMLRVVDIGAMAKIAHEHDSWLAVDNTFASPCVCRPLECGADFVLESLTKIMNGHSDVLLGFVGGDADRIARLRQTSVTWGFTPAPFDTWLAARGLGTMALRVERACQSAAHIAARLQSDGRVRSVTYPGLPDHLDGELCRRQFLEERYGHVLSVTLDGGWEAATRFIAAAKGIPFSPSLGDLCTTLSHPASTSHRKLTPAERLANGIDDGTLRLSVGIEPASQVLEHIEQGLKGAQ